MTVYVGSDGRVYTPSAVVERLERGEWRSCLYDVDDGRELVETGDGDLVLLVPRGELDANPTVEELARRENDCRAVRDPGDRSRRNRGER